MGEQRGSRALSVVERRAAELVELEGERRRDERALQALAGARAQAVAARRDGEFLEVEDEARDHQGGDPVVIVVVNTCCCFKKEH